MAPESSGTEANRPRAIQTWLTLCITLGTRAVFLGIVPSLLPSLHKQLYSGSLRRRVSGDLEGEARCEGIEDPQPLFTGFQMEPVVGWIRWNKWEGRM